MKLLDQFLECAKLDDPHQKWEIIRDPCITEECFVVGFRYPAHRGYIECGNYNSLDRLFALVKKQCETGENCSWETMVLHLVAVLKVGWYDRARDLYPLKCMAIVFVATPAQVREALLRATGKWK